MGRVRYFIRVEPIPEDGAESPVPPELRHRILEALSHRFSPTLRDYWDAIDITSAPGNRVGPAANREMHRRLNRMLDEADPSWAKYFVIVPYHDAWSRCDEPTHFANPS